MSKIILELSGPVTDVREDGLEAAEGKLVGVGGGLDGAVVRPGVGAVGCRVRTGRQGAGQEKGEILSIVLLLVF